MRLFAAYVDRRGGWLRLCGRGISWTVAPPLFSERSGSRRPFLRIGGLRLFWLPARRDAARPGDAGLPANTGVPALGQEETS